MRSCKTLTKSAANGLLQMRKVVTSEKEEKKCRQNKLEQREREGVGKVASEESEKWQVESAKFT